MSILRKFEVPGGDVVFHREGEAPIVEPVPRKRNRLSEFLASLSPTGEGLPEIEDPPVELKDAF